MDKISVFISPDASPMLKDMLKKTLGETPYDIYHKDIPESKIYKKVIFAMELNHLGFDFYLWNLLYNLYQENSSCFNESLCAILIHSSSELYTKDSAQNLIFLVNNMGGSFLGKPLVEATISLDNFKTWQKSLKLTKEEICFKMCRELGARLINHKSTIVTKPKILVLYSSPHKTSNTLDLWHMVSKQLQSCSIEELQIENGKIQDCKGCSYKACVHFGNQNSCFYGGFMVENILPSVANCDSLVMLCPNYNDALSGNITSVINRLTVLYLKMSFSSKNVFGLIVSGNSGGDSVCKQLIGALNINKGFKLPKNAILCATANDPGAIFKTPDIELTVKKFAENMQKEISQRDEII